MNRRTITAWLSSLFLVVGSLIGLLGAAPGASASTSAAKPAATPAASTTNYWATFYGWYDNSPPGAGISYPDIHQTAGGTGTFSNPITFASYTGELAKGSVIYYPTVKKYFIMEDDCTECDLDWKGKGPDGGPNLHHVDLWSGGQGGNEFDAIDCEDALTQTNPDGTPLLTPFIVNPPSNEPVDSTPIFNVNTGACYGGAVAQTTVGQYKNPSSGKCIDDPGNSSATSTALTSVTCNGSAEQQISFNGAFFIVNGKCFASSGSKIILSSCSGGPTEQWSVNPNGTISDIQTSKKCFGVSGSALAVLTCSGSAAAQQWVFSTPTANNDFSISDSPASASVLAGASATSTVSTTITSGAAQSVALTTSGAPAGVTVSLSPASVTAGASSTLTAKTTAATVAGTYPITVTGTAASGTHTATYTLTVTTKPATNDFSVSLSPASDSVLAGGSTTSTVSTAVVSGTAQAVALTTSGAPAGVSVSLSPASVTAGGSSTLTATTTSAAAAGTYPITVTGTSSSAAHSATYTLTVTTPSTGGPVTYEAESSANTLTGTADVYTCAACSGGARVGDIGAGAGTLTINNVTVPTAGTYQVVVTGTQDQGSTLTAYISVNGGANTKVVYARTASWSTDENMTVPMVLNAGSNTITFSNPTKNCPDIDAITVPASGS